MSTDAAMRRMTLDRDRVSGARCEGVAEERQRSGRPRGSDEVVGQRRIVQREVRRRDHRHRVRADLPRVRRQGHRVSRGLRAGMNDEDAGQRVAVPLGDPPALVEAEEHALAGGATGKHAVRPVGLEEGGVRRDGRAVDLDSALGERRDGGDDQGPALAVGEHAGECYRHRRAARTR